MAPSNNTTYSSQGKNPNSTKKHIAVVLYVLSISLGLVGTALVIDQEIDEPQHVNSRISHRALYAFILLMAGILLEKARSHTPPQLESKKPDDRPTNVTVKEINSSLESKDPNESKEKREMGSEALNKASDIELTNLPSSAPEKSVAEEKPEAQDETTSQPPIKIEVAALPSISPPTQPIWQQPLCYLRDLLPSAWFAQSMAMFVQNAMEESTPTAQVLPYTTLAGLATGYLFNVSIQPWSLGGMRDWITRYRNHLTAIEWLIPTLGYSRKNFLLSSVVMASFFIGYNLGVAGATKKKEPSSKEPSFKEKELQNLMPHHPPDLCKSLLASISGALLSGLSLWVARQPSANLHSAFLRDYGALWMMAIGNYALTYPIGTYLVRYLPKQYHERTLTVATYLLVPFASPALTIPHYILMLGAGICGGAGHAILSDQYENRLKQMEVYSVQVNELVKDNPLFAKLLSDLKLPADLLWEQENYKNRKFKWLLCIAVSGQFISFFPSIPTLPRNYLFSEPLLAKLGTVAMLFL